MDGSGIYIEKQKPTQKWVIVLATVICFSSIVTSIYIYINAKGTSTLIALVPLITGLVPFFLLTKTKLVLTIDSEKISYRFYPFHRRNKEIKKSDIQELQVGTYDPISDYGGWGIRYGIEGMAYTVSGNYGIKIKLNNNKNVLIGTNNPDQVHNYLKEKEYIR
jgi:hypothetical protein